MVRKFVLDKVRTFIRDIVFGMEDGLVSNLGIVFAVWSAGSSKTIILLAGLASLFAGAFSMSAGSYLSSKSQREVYESEVEDIKSFIKHTPKKAIGQMRQFLKNEGFDKNEIDTLSKHFLKHNRDTFLQNYVQKKLQISPERFEKPLRNAFAMFFAFSFGSLFPIFPFFLGNSNTIMIFATSITIFVLFLVGVTKCQVTKRSWYKSGFEMVLLGIGAGIVGYVIGFVFGKFV